MLRINKTNKKDSSFRQKELHYCLPWLTWHLCKVILVCKKADVQLVTFILNNTTHPSHPSLNINFIHGRTPFTWQLGSFQELKSAKDRWEELKLGKVHLLSFKAIWRQSAFQLDELHCSIPNIFCWWFFLLFHWGDWDVFNVKPYQNSMKFQLFRGEERGWNCSIPRVGNAGHVPWIHGGKCWSDRVWMKKPQHFEKHMFLNKFLCNP